ncbi:PLD nuclease N-terminal domain-containing protein [Paenibacillus sp. MSJ-34]|uniref:PLD nuclease N-terminal domain-containing protein n=1 Tax=Paenibacillus sp. MSJ-34 TaxID=2841529 RepID=UPI001C109AED|nr:PLD nuclease N-terminal domain-containing protein [Paenibacillus sp. MSJ-34]MBU5442380.1 PLD nuclease N-terminal domain-containing protein [Paenibacillus sp. MSJ-34]
MKMHYGYKIEWDQLAEWLPILMPFIVLNLILIAAALWDIIRSDRNRESKWLWAALSVCVSLLGPILYFAIGRRGR